MTQSDTSAAETRAGVAAAERLAVAIGPVVFALAARRSPARIKLDWVLTMAQFALTAGVAALERDAGRFAAAFTSALSAPMRVGSSSPARISLPLTLRVGEVQHRLAVDPRR